MKIKSYTITGMHCTSCAIMIESDLEDIGVSAKVNYAKQTLEVKFDESKVNEEKIKQVVSSSGYKLVF